MHKSTVDVIDQNDVKFRNPKSACVEKIINIVIILHFYDMTTIATVARDK